ncbi:MAG: PEP-CTERM sorting domain-containing protein [Aquabacterium sp.]|jgi:hypothetical protein
MTIQKLSSAIALFALAGAASAANQPFTATNAAVTINTSAISSTGYTVSATGGASLSGSTLTIGVESVSLDASPGPLDINFNQAAGLRLAKGATVATLTDFTFDLATNTLFGDLNASFLGVSVLSLNDQSLLTASTVSSSFGGVVGTNITSSSTARTLGLQASGFALSQGFRDYLLGTGQNPDDFGYIADLITNVKIGTVSVTPTVPAIPEPSTYALMGLGLVGMALVSRRRRQA